MTSTWTTAGTPTGHQQDAHSGHTARKDARGRHRTPGQRLGFVLAHTSLSWLAGVDQPERQSVVSLTEPPPLQTPGCLPTCLPACLPALSNSARPPPVGALVRRGTGLVRAFCTGLRRGLLDARRGAPGSLGVRCRGQRFALCVGHCNQFCRDLIFTLRLDAVRSNSLPKS